MKWLDDKKKMWKKNKEDKERARVETKEEQETEKRLKREERAWRLLYGPKWVDVTEDPGFPEVWLMLRSLRKGRLDRNRGDKPQRWPERCDDWAVHASVYPRIKYNNPTAGLDTFKESRMEFLNKHLDVLDSKIGWLLNFNTLRLIALNVLFGAMYSLVPKDSSNHLPTHSLFQPGYWLASTVVLLGLLFGLLWIAIVWLCMLGERRVIWGDLGKHLTASQKRNLLLLMLSKHEREAAVANGAVPNTEDDKKAATVNDTDLAEAERTHVISTIITIVKRTNKFRIATYLTWFSIGDLIAITAAGLWLLGRHYW